MEINRSVNNHSLNINMSISERSESKTYYNMYGNIEYNDDGTQKYVNVSNIEFDIFDKISTIHVNFLGSELEISMNNNNHMAFITLMTNIETFGITWWENYRKLYDDAFSLILPDNFIKHVDDNIKTYFREKNIDQILDENL